ncbi:MULTISPECIES: hypothetical protein [Rhodobacterales]|uniref:hypothetical protein n=1 Tax=Rhodobacterales TaxID=204455 RepID=UPI00215DBBFF|nr:MULTISPECIES: hypothetical protein [Rhodobacterales]
MKGASDYVCNPRWRGHDIIRDRVAKYGIECDLTAVHIEAAIKPSHMDQLKAIEAEGRQRGFGDDMTLIGQDEIQKQSSTSAGCAICAICTCIRWIYAWAKRAQLKPSAQRFLRTARSCTSNTDRDHAW